MPSPHQSKKSIYIIAGLVYISNLSLKKQDIMKTKLLAVLLTATLALAAVPTSASAQDATQTASMEAIGASASFGLFTAHMAINSLGDGWDTKAYTKETALPLAGGYKAGVKAVSNSLEKLVKEGTTLGDDDKAALGILVEICTLVAAQAEALTAHVSAPSAKNAADYQAKRVAAEKKIFEFMGIGEGILPVIGDSIGKE